jgi:serine/threonine-protein kinase
VLLHQVRRVRAALDQGVLDDPDLTSDLTPTVQVRRLAGEDIDYVRDEPDASPGGHGGQTILSPAQAAGHEDDTDTSVIGTRAAARKAPPARGGGRPAGQPRRSRRGPLLLLVVLLLAVAAGVGGWWFGAGRFTSTPGVVNLSARAAETEVESAGLTFRVDGRAYSETVPAGSVVSTEPAGGENVVRHGTVAAVLSRGPERHDVPRLTGLTLDRAQAALASERLEFGDATYAYSPTVAEGDVLRSDPAPGTSLRRGAVVDLTVSKGPAPVKVPDVVGEDADSATAALKRLKFTVDASLENSDTVDKGDVVSQSPRTGKLPRGAEVRLVVSKGPVLVEVPEVRRMTPDAAAAALRSAGFEVATVKVEYYIGIGLVVKQSPGAGEKAPKGSTITIYIV